MVPALEKGYYLFIVYIAITNSQMEEPLDRSKKYCKSMGDPQAQVEKGKK